MLLKTLQIFAFFLPFQMALNPAPGIDLASVRIFILLLFFFWLSASLLRKRLIIKCDLATFFIALFLFLNLFSIFFARNPDWSARKIIFLFSIFPIYFVFSAAIEKREQALKIFKVLIVSGALSAVIGILQFIAQFFWGIEKLYAFWGKNVTPFSLGRAFSETVLTYPSWLVNISGQTYFRALAFFPDPHMFSLFLGMLLPISLGLFWTERKKIWLFSTILIFLADILTFSRGAYLGLLAGLIFLIFFWWKKIKKEQRVYFLVLGFLFFLILALPGPIASRFHSSFDLQEGSNLGRIEMWEAATAIIYDKPFWGTGIGNFGLAVDPLSDYREPIYAHNTYLDIAAETGIVAMLSWIALVLFSAWACLKKNPGNFIWLGVSASLIIFFAHSMVETGLYSPVVLTLFLIIIALSNITEKNEKLA